MSNALAAFMSENPTALIAILLVIIVAAMGGVR